MNDWKLIVGVVGGSLLLLVLAVVGFGKLQQQGQQAQEARVLDESLVAEILDGDRLAKTNGDQAEVTIIEFSDFQCPACKAAESLVQGLAEVPGVQLVYRHFPLTQIHNNAQLAGEASEAANAQGKFWEYHGILFERQDDWKDVGNPTDMFVEYAGELELDTDKFRSELEEGVYKERVLADQALGLRAGVNATPTFVVDGKVVSAQGLITELQGFLESKQDVLAPPADGQNVEE